MNLGRIDSDSANACMISTNWSTKSQCDCDAQRCIIKSCANGRTWQRLKECSGMGCCGRIKAGNTCLVMCGGQHYFHGDSNKWCVPCPLFDDDLRKLALICSRFPFFNSSNEQLVVDTS